MKKLIIWAIAFSLTSTALFGQSPREAIIVQLTKDTCTELSKADLSAKSSEELKTSIGLAFMTAAGKNADHLKDLGLNLSDSQSMQKFGAEIGMHLVTDCPPFMSAISKNEDILKQATQNAKSSNTGVIAGKLVKIVEGEFTHLQVEDPNGKIEKLWWLEYFDGSNKLIRDAQNQLNKPIKVRYIEKETFNSILKDYVKIKIITAIE